MENTIYGKSDMIGMGMQSDNVPPSTQQGQIASKLVEMDKIVVELWDDITKLEKKLDPVLRASIPTANSGEADKAQSICKLASELGQRNYKLSISVAAILSITSRIEL